jgi:hypothetical protein
MVCPHPPHLIGDFTTYLVHLRWWVTLVRTIVIRELESSLSRIHQLPLLEAISLRFNPVYKTCSDADLDGQGRAVLQASILGALATSFSVCAPSKLTSLSLHNLRSSDPPALETFPFQAILASLQRLQLSVLFDCASVPSTFFARWCHFWSNLFPHTPAVPIQTQLSLTELTLHSDEYVGALCGLSLRELDFPSLSVLSLRSIVFDPILGAEDFILRHASTLARLELLDCKVLMSANRFPSLSPCTTMATGVELGPSIYWDRIWDRFAAKLTALVMLYVDEPLENPMHSCTYFRYVHRRVETYEKYVLIYGDESRVMADHAALQRFYITVAASARSKEGRVEP